MWTSKILAILLAVGLLIFTFRALLNRKQKQALHESVQLIAKVLLLVATLSALWTFYKRYG